MSSWFPISLPNPFKSDDQNPSPPPEDAAPSSDDHGTPLAGGVREDLSVLGQTIGRQLRGVAAFLAPPPDSSPSSDAGESSSQTLLGIKSDLFEIGGSFKTNLSLLSSNNAVSEISRIASNLLQFESEENEFEGDQEDEEDESQEADGVTEEVLDFVEELSLRPECWTEFLISLHSDFTMSDAQKEHASAIERLVPNLAALRHQTCSYMSEEKFWMIYFIFLLPRLHENHAKLLSTPEILEAREILLQKLQNERNAPVETSEDYETEANNSQGEMAKEVLAVPVKAEQNAEADRENSEKRLEEEDVDASTSSADARIQPDSEEVSFSDLEDDDNDLSGRLSRLRRARNESVTSSNTSNEWVRLNENSGVQGGGQKAGGQSISREKDSDGESNDWLTVDEVDLDSLAAA